MTSTPVMLAAQEQIITMQEGQECEEHQEVLEGGHLTQIDVSNVDHQVAAQTTILSTS